MLVFSSKPLYPAVRLILSGVVFLLSSRAGANNIRLNYLQGKADLLRIGTLFIVFPCKKS